MRASTLGFKVIKAKGSIEALYGRAENTLPSFDLCRIIWPCSCGTLVNEKCNFDFTIDFTTTGCNCLPCGIFAKRLWEMLDVVLSYVQMESTRCRSDQQRLLGVMQAPRISFRPVNASHEALMVGSKRCCPKCLYSGCGDSVRLPSSFYARHRNLCQFPRISAPYQRRLASFLCVVIR